MIICAYVDIMGTFAEDPEEEYKKIEKEFKKTIKEDFFFKTDILPHDLKNQKVDIYIIDLGGMLPGCEDMILSHFRELVKQIEEKPNTLFIIYSVMTQRWYKEAIERYAPELKEDFNVLFFMDQSYEDKLRGWVSGTDKGMALERN